LLHPGAANLGERSHWATVLKPLGIDHTQDYTVRRGRPVGIVAKDAKLIGDV